MSDPFYRAFEERYRGDRDLIAERLKAYDSFTVPLAAAYPGAVALDLGCGRGEWLELTARLGFAAFGVDLDEGMLAACRERGLHVETADAMATLRARADASVALISAFHLVEHMPFEVVQALVAEAQRVLVPGGLLILETPNAENLVVGTNNFYLDPSHLKPVPALLLEFLADYAGFARKTVVRLHGEPVPADDQPIGLLTVLQGVSFDYALVAQKQADGTLLAPFDSAFAERYGSALIDMAARFDERFLSALATVEARAAQSDKLDAQAREQGNSLAALNHGLQDLAGQINQRVTALDREMQGLKEHLRIELSLQSTLQMAAMEKRMDAAVDQIDARSTRRANEAEERRLQREHQFQQRIETVERYMDQSDRRIAPLARRLTESELALREAAANTAEIQRQADYTAWRLSTTEEELRQERARSAEVEARLHALHANLVSLVDSSSWRLTAPLRMFSGYGRRALAAARDGRVLSGIARRLADDDEAAAQPDPASRADAPGTLRALQKRIKHSTLARRVALPLLRRFPMLEHPLRRLSDAPLPPAPQVPAGPAPLQGADADILLPPDFATLPESAREVLLDLARTGRSTFPPQQ